jgi:hypothetical protein
LCQALASRILVTEGLTGHEAAQLGSKPREGKSEAPLTRPWKEHAAPPAKKQRGGQDSTLTGLDGAADNAGTLFLHNI